VDRRGGTKSDGQEEEQEQQEEEERRGLQKCGGRVADATIAAAAIIVGLIPVAALVTRIDRLGLMGLLLLRIHEDMDGLLRLRLPPLALRLLPPSNGRTFYPTRPSLRK
jgi:hypothetical protein